MLSIYKYESLKLGMNIEKRGGTERFIFQSDTHNLGQKNFTEPSENGILNPKAIILKSCFI